MQEIENSKSKANSVCVRFQYATPSNIDSIQYQLFKYFNNSITTRTELHEQLDKSLQLLQYSKRDIAHSIVQSHLRTLLTTKHSLFHVSDLLSLFQTLKSNPPTFSNSRQVLGSYLQIIAIITTLGWINSTEFEVNFSAQLKELESGQASDFPLIALFYVVTEMNEQTSGIKGFTQHRKTAIAFRDTQLLPLLKTSYSLLTKALDAMGSPVMSVPGSILEYSLKIVNACLNYDFLGYQQDQDNHGMTSAIQVPSDWKQFVFDDRPIEVLINAFKVLPQIYHEELLEAIGYLMGCKRSLFSETDRIVFVTRLINYCLTLLEFPFENECQTEFYKVLLRFATVYSTDLKNAGNSLEFFKKFMVYTNDKFENANHVDYLNMVLIWFMLFESESLYFTEQIREVELMIQRFVNLDSEMLQCLYFDETITFEQLIGPLGKILRKTFTTSSKLLVERIQRFGFGSTPEEHIETAWTISIYAAALAHRLPYQATNESDISDGHVSGNVFQIISYKSFEALSDGADEIFEIAILSFFEQFKFSFISSESSNSLKIWEPLNTICRIDSQEKVIAISLTRILYFLRRSTSEKLVVKAASLFHELVVGSHSCKLLQKSELLAFIEESGVFELTIDCSYAKSKVIMEVFESIGRLFFSHQFNDNPEASLNRLLDPICAYLFEYSKTGDHRGTMDLCIRRLRGILSAIYTSKLFMAYFDRVAQYLPLIGTYVTSDAAINGPYNGLRLIKEISTNKISRLNFEANGEYGAAIAVCEKELGRLEPLLNSTTLNENERHGLCIKPLYIVLEIFKNLISSKSVPFGIMNLYSDPKLPEMIRLGYFLSSAVKFSHISTYQKLATAYFSFWTSMTGDSVRHLMANVTSDTFDALLMNCYEAIELMDDAIASQACSIVDRIFTVAIESNLMFFEINPNVHHEKFTQLLLFRVLTGDLESQWSFTRPLLPLILFESNWFVQYINALISSQSENQPKFREILEGLVRDLDGTLSIKNRDSLTRNIDAAKRALLSNRLSVYFPVV